MGILQKGYYYLQCPTTVTVSIGNLEHLTSILSTTAGIVKIWVKTSYHMQQNYSFHSSFPMLGCVSCTKRTCCFFLLCNIIETIPKLQLGKNKNKIVSLWTCQVYLLIFYIHKKLKIST